MRLQLILPGQGPAPSLHRLCARRRNVSGDTLLCRPCELLHSAHGLTLDLWTFPDRGTGWGRRRRGSRSNSPGPIQVVGREAISGPFSPRLTPSSGGSQRGQTRGGRAIDANWPCRASRLPPPSAQPGPSLGVCTARRVGLGRTYPRSSVENPPGCRVCS